jgi:purine-binding chemotaxis protein CheW
MPEQSLREVEQSFLLLTFQVGQAQYGLEAVRVQEVILVGSVTPVHHAPEYVRGIINLRGKIVTVVDLSTKLLDVETIPGENSRILITEWKDEYVGLLVDCIGDVLSLDRDQVETAPANVDEGQSHYIQGVYRDAGHVVAVLDLDALLS